MFFKTTSLAKCLTKLKTMKFRILQLIILPFAFLFICQIANSQIPKGFSYQTVIRNSSGQPLASQDVSIRITLTNDTGTPVYYSEIHSKTTTPQGIVNLTIGSGAAQDQGDINNVLWKNGNVWVKVEVNKNDGAGYISMGLTQLQSVPYAQYAVNGTWASAHTVTSSATAGPDDPIFEVKNKDGNVVLGVYQGGVRVYVEDAVIKGAKGGFAVGGLSNQAKASTEYFRITPDSARIWIKEVPSIKGAKGGFAVGGLSNKKLTDSDYFNVSPVSTPLIINDNAQLLWYPLKEAFLVGRVQVLDPADVGLNSFSSGYHSKAKGDYSQAMGTNSVASGLYSMAIGESCIASGQYSFALGSNSEATNTNNVAIGNNSKAIGYTNNYAFGNNATASGDNDNYAFGSNSKIIEGRDCYAIGSHAEIYPLIYNGSGSAGSYAIGNYALVKGQRAYAIGDHAQALNNDAIAFGTNTKSTAYVSIAIGANGSNADTTYATGQASIAMGYAANSGGLSSISLGTRSIASSDYSVAIGNLAEATAINATAIGYGAIANIPNKVRIGNGAVSVIEGQVAFTSASDMRLKKNIKDLSTGLDFILKLRPVEYQMIQGDNKTNYGFIAQDIEQLVGANNSMLTIGADADRTLGLRYTDFIAPLVKALQEQQVQIDALKAENAQLKNNAKEIQNLKAELEAIKNMLKK